MNNIIFLTMRSKVFDMKVGICHWIFWHCPFERKASMNAACGWKPVNWLSLVFLDYLSPSINVIHWQTKGSEK